MIYLNNSFIHIFVENPLKTWWKARKYFKIPRLHIKFFFAPQLKYDDEYLRKKLKDRSYKNPFKEKIEHIKTLINSQSYHNSCPYANYKRTGKILDVYSSDVLWKDKYGSPRHEKSPYIFFCLFRLIGFAIRFYIPAYNEFGEKENGDLYYWEYLLDYLYYEKTLEVNKFWFYSSKIYRKTISGDEAEDRKISYEQVIQAPLFSLNKRGLKEFKKLYV